MVGSKFSTNVHLAPWPMALGVPAVVGHGVRGAANGRAGGVRLLPSWPQVAGSLASWPMAAGSLAP
jgi:hypothetical protein